MVGRGRLARGQVFVAGQLDVARSDLADEQIAQVVQVQAVAGADAAHVGGARHRAAHQQPLSEQRAKRRYRLAAVRAHHLLIVGAAGHRFGTSLGAFARAALNAAAGHLEAVVPDFLDLEQGECHADSPFC